jgi:flagellin-like protein
MGFRKDNRAVSPVVGTILLIAITVALAAIVATLVSGLGGRGAPPSVMLTVTAQDDGSNGVILTISHNGGDDLTLKDLTVEGSNNLDIMTPVSSLTNVSGSGTTLTVGGTATGTYDYGGDSSGQVITVYVIHNPSKQKLFSSSAIPVAAPAP